MRGISVSIPSDSYYSGILCVVIYVPLCFIRKIEKLSWSHLIADFIILFTFLVIIGYTIKKLVKDGGNPGPHT